MTHTYNITGMTCNGCTARVKNELLKLGDITAAEVQLNAPQATITMSTHISLAGLQKAVSQAGSYTITAADTSMPVTEAQATEQSNSYFPILLIFGYILGVSLLVQWANESFSTGQWMSHFMAGFFLVFSFFKFMNLRGFAEGYRTYDLIARKMPAWGFIYPFVELGLGLAFLVGLEPLTTNAITFIVMAVSTIGVANSLLKKQVFQCACLGTVIKLPLSKVTLAEDVLMVAMSGAMITMLVR